MDEPYSKVTRRVWADEKFRGLSAPKPNAQTLWLYLLPGARCTSIPGLLAVGAMSLAEDLNWPVTATKRCLAEIEACGLARIDHAARLIWLPNAMVKHNMPANASVVLGWALPWKALPECLLRAQAGEAMRAALAAEDDRRIASGAKPGGLAAAFGVVLGEQTFAESGLRGGRPRKQTEAPQEQGEEHPGGPPKEQGEEHRVPHPVKLQEQDQDQDHEIRNTPRACASEANPGTTDLDRAGSARLPLPLPPRPDPVAYAASVGDLDAIAHKLAAEGNGFAQQMVELLDELKPLTAPQRAKLREIAEGNGRAPRISPEAQRIWKRWTEAREHYGLPVDDKPSAKVVEFEQKILRAIEYARSTGKYVPTMEYAADHAMNQYLKDEVSRGSEGPFAFLVARFGETYGLPVKPEGKAPPKAPSAPAVPPPAPPLPPPPPPIVRQPSRPKPTGRPS